MEDFRCNLEQTIIGACLLENGYVRVAGVLTSRNFSKFEYYDHQLIFKAIESLYPTRPVDVLTITHQINKDGYAFYLAECMAKVCSSENLLHHAYILLQLGMRDTLIHTLDSVRGAHISNTTHATIQEIIDECLDTTNDIVRIYEKALTYLETNSVDDFIVARIRDLNNILDRKVNAIKNQAHIDSLMNNLLAISNSGNDTNTRLGIKMMTDHIKAALVIGIKDPATLEQIAGIRI